MAKLITIDCEDLLQAGADPRELWRAVKQILDGLNDLTITVSPDDAGSEATINEGDIKLNLKVPNANWIPGYAPPGSSVETDGSMDGFSGATGDGSWV